MEDETSWFTNPCNNASSEVVKFEKFTENNDEGDKNSSVSLDYVLPDDLLDRVFAYLPVAGILRAGCVSKRWNEVVKSKRFLWNWNLSSQKPWYYMFTSSDGVGGYAYDPIFKKWYCFELPCIKASNWVIASSNGLVCFMDNDSRSQLYICNPITRTWKRLLEPPGLKSDYSTLAVSVDRKSNSYTVSIVKSTNIPDDFLQWDLSIHVYSSKSQTWATLIAEVLTGWRGGNESVVCGGILYCLIYSTMVLGSSENRHGLIMYDLRQRCSHASLIRTCIPVPCSLTCGRLMNLNNELVMVGGIGKPDRPDIIKGIGIWILVSRQWIEVSKMPHKFFQGFGELDDVFASSGTDDLIYIQSYGATALLVFDMNQKQWRWSQKCPVTKKFPLQLFTGFCFEPRLEVTP